MGYILFENYYTASGLANVVTGSTWYAQGFTPTTTHNINRISLYMNRSTLPTSVTVSIRATSGEAPTGEDIVSANFNVNDIGTSLGWVSVDITPTELTASIKYALVLRANGTVWWGYTGTDPAGTYTGGQLTLSINAGVDWITGSDTYDTHFREYGRGSTVTTQACTYTIATKSTGHGTLTSKGDSEVTQHGHCWATTANPTTSDSKTTNGTAPNLGQFQSAMTGLTPGTTYYVAAYATNTEGTAYGDDVEITTATTIGRRHSWTEGTKRHYFDEFGDERAIEGVPVNDGLPWWYFT